MVYWKVQKYDRLTLKYRRPDSSFQMVTKTGGTASEDSFRVSSANSMVRAVGEKEDWRMDNNDSPEDDEEEDDSEDEPKGARFTKLNATSNTTTNNQHSSPVEQPEKAKLVESASWWDVHYIIQEWRRRRELFREDHPRTYEVFQQSLWYLGVFYITHIWSTSNRTIQLINNGSTYYGLIVIHSFFDPLQGFLNFLVYQRPRFLRIRAFHPNASAWYAMRQALTLSCFGGAELSNRTLSRSTAARRSQRQANQSSSLRKSRNSSGGGRDSEQSDDMFMAKDTAETSLEFELNKSLGIIIEEDSSDLYESRRSIQTAVTKSVVPSTHTCGTTGDAPVSESSEFSVECLEAKLRAKKFVR